MALKRKIQYDIKKVTKNEGLIMYSQQSTVWPKLAGTFSTSQQ